MATKFYAVRQGRATGIFESWAECQKQVTGYKGAEFKSFLLLEEAKAYMAGGTFSEETLQVAAKKKSDGLKVWFQKHPDAMVAFVDGSFHSGTGEFSYGMVLLTKGPGESDDIQEQEFCEKFSDPELAAMRNVAGEIKGAEAAMRYACLQGFQKLYIYHDYEGIAKWCLGEWKTNKEGTKAYKAYYDSVQQDVQVSFVKVAAHTGDKYNEMADELAKKALGIK